MIRLIANIHFAIFVKISTTDYAGGTDFFIILCRISFTIFVTLNVRSFICIFFVFQKSQGFQQRKPPAKSTASHWYHPRFSEQRL